MQFLKIFLSTAFAVFFMLSINIAFAGINVVDSSKNSLFTSYKVSKMSVRPYEGLIQKIAIKHKVPINLAHAVINVESSYNASTKGSSGEIGLMQIKPSTARWLGFNGPVKDLYEPAINLEYGMRYLARAHKLSRGDTCRTVLKYNAGHSAKKMNSISARYCSKVKTYLASFK
ncbi:Transmembrane protein [Bartonella clarridgeiae 73]|uniref:Transmembrane protein n=1 Tax=Bartonella clarridgeiae (strain CCUG 45776 / CIP 104772 / 73) TaxID=696125 RepID=E6YIK1_BARC7|nr:transglycosylase SLT domain-containing protein [Bartonella clarridgeiae]WCR54745.1 MAG: Soluble lytic murein transglycosylase and related regulatory proteins (some containing LysM/invasin domains) [Bartonella clarridgeiae]CBI76689.1 Transmembrane protein [Bartonella clarridgeiae 73]